MVEVEYGLTGREEEVDCVRIGECEGQLKYCFFGMAGKVFEYLCFVLYL
jgi:hypothetical protein